jgi:hypothetical protein
MAAAHPATPEREGWAGSIAGLVSRAWIDVMLAIAPEPLATMCGSTCFEVSQLAPEVGRHYRYLQDRGRVA